MLNGFWAWQKTIRLFCLDLELIFPFYSNPESWFFGILHLAKVRSRVGEKKKLLEAKIKEVKLKIAAEDRVVKQEEIFKEKNNSLKARKKEEKSKSTDQRLIRLETALAEAEDESCSWK